MSVEHSLYNGQIKLFFNEKARNRYTVEGNGDPHSPVGTTTVLTGLAKPALMTWPMWEALTYIKTVEKVTEEEIEIASKAYLVKSDTGKDTGKAVHAAIEAF